MRPAGMRPYAPIPSSPNSSPTGPAVRSRTGTGWSLEDLRTHAASAGSRRGGFTCRVTLTRCDTRRDRRLAARPDEGGHSALSQGIAAGASSPRRRRGAGPHVRAGRPDLDAGPRRGLVPARPRPRARSRRPSLSDVPRTAPLAAAARRDGARPGCAAPPRCVQPLDAHVQPARGPACPGVCDSRDRRVGVHATRARGAAARSRREGPRRPERGREGVHARRAVGRRRVRPRRRDARAAQEPRATDRGCSSHGHRAPCRRRARVGGVEIAGNGVHWLGEVSDVELARLYRGAMCVAYPSLYEGFGIPVLEAMACGVPVVTTRGTAMEEVADGAAVLVDARDPAEIAAGIERAASERDRLVARGLERARSFRWDSVAEATVAVYREAALA